MGIERAVVQYAVPGYLFGANIELWGGVFEALKSH